MNGTNTIICSSGTSTGPGSGSWVWVNPSRITANDGSYATATWTPGGGTSETDELKAQNFVWSPAIPNHAIIKGIVVVIRRMDSSTTYGFTDWDLFLIDQTGTTKTGWTNKGDRVTNWPNSPRPANATYGSTTDVWGGGTIRGWQVNNSNWGCSLRVHNILEPPSGSSVASVDYISMQLTYKVGRQTLMGVGI